MSPARHAGDAGRQPRIARLGLGCAQLGNLGAPMAEEAAHAIVHTALEAGCTHFDTAPHYGAGLSEQRLGRALSGVPRRSYTLATKVGRRLRPLAPGERAAGEGFVDTPPYAREWDFSRDGIHRTLEASMRRLGTDHIEVAFLHDVEHHLPEVRTTGFAALAELRDQHVVGRIGFGMNFSDVLARLVAEFDVDVVLCAGRWTLLDRSAWDDGLLSVCEERGTAVVVGGVYNSGILADPRPGSHYDYRPASAQLLRRAQQMADVCERYGVPLRAAALRFPFGHPSVVSAVVGAAAPEEVRDNARLTRRRIPTALWQQLVAEGLLDDDLPLPTPLPSRSEEQDQP
ncbi:aldo/keto reductase [Streptomyces sp. CA-250714]|uniref:aldo/keto reductase n=1 Tax=Streptomyces sp. CA-250714 TaxID=3240060 RepID=UPI003D93DD38